MKERAVSAIPILIERMRSEAANPQESLTMWEFVFGDFGPLAQDAFGPMMELVRSGRDPDDFVPAMVSVAPGNPELVSYLLKMMESRRYPPDYASKYLFQWAGTNPSIQEWAQCMLDKERARKELSYEADPYARERLETVLAIVAVSDPKALKTIARAMKSKNVLVRSAATRALGLAGKDTRKATALLLKALKDKEHSVRAVAAESLARVAAKDDDRVIQALTKTLESETEYVQKLARHEGAHDADTARNSAARALGDMMPTAVTAIPALIRSGTVGYSFVGVSAHGEPPPLTAEEEAFKKAGKITLPSILTEMKSTDPAIRSAALSALNIIAEPEMTEAVAPVLEMLQDPRLFAGASAALIGLGQGEKALPAAMEYLRGDDKDLQFQAMAFLMRLGPAAKDALPDVIELFAVGEPIPGPSSADAPHEDWSNRWFALELVERMGSEAISVVPKLLQLLDSDGRMHIDQKAAMALGWILADPTNAPSYRRSLRYGSYYE